MRKILFTTLFTITLSMPFTYLHAEFFQLERKFNKKIDGILGTSSIYKAPKQLNVNYAYVFSVVYGKPVLFILYNEKQTNINVLLDNGSKVNNLDAAILKKTILKNMPKVSMNDEFGYEGTATVTLKDIEIWTSKNLDLESTVTIVDVLKNSPPKKVSYETF